VEIVHALAVYSTLAIAKVGQIRPCWFQQPAFGCAKTGVFEASPAETREYGVSHIRGRRTEATTSTEFNGVRATYRSGPLAAEYCVYNPLISFAAAMRMPLSRHSPPFQRDN